MKTRTLKQVQYEDCNECLLFETPDKNGKIPLPNKGTLRLNPFIYNKEGEKIPNPIAGRCGYKGCTIEHPEVGCGTWFTL